MHLLKSISLVAVLCLYMGSSLAATPVPATSPAAAVCERYGPKTLELLKSRNYLEAINTVAAYEEAILALYSAPSFEHKRLQSDRRHLSISVPFDRWAAHALTEIDKDGSLNSIGYEPLLFLKGDNPDEVFAVLAMDHGNMMQRMGFNDGKEIDDQELKTLGSTFSAAFGAADTIAIQKFGTDRAAVVTTKASPRKSPGTIICLLHGQTLLTFVLFSSSETMQDNLKQLDQAIRAGDFDYKPSDVNAVARIRAARTDKTDLEQAITCVRDLALAGEWQSAAADLSGVRSMIGNQLPKPTIEKEVARDPLYGIRLKNPDPARWKLSLQTMGNQLAMVLEDHNSVHNGMIMVATINTTLAFGPKMNAKLANPAEEAARRKMLAGAGRGALSNMGGVIDGERFSPFKGLSAFHGSAAVAAKNLKARVVVAMDGDCMLLVISIIDPLEFTNGQDDYDKIVDESLQLETKTPPIQDKP